MNWSLFGLVVTVFVVTLAAWATLLGIIREHYRERIAAIIREVAGDKWVLGRDLHAEIKRQLGWRGWWFSRVTFYVMMMHFEDEGFVRRQREEKEYLGEKIHVTSFRVRTW